MGTLYVTFCTNVECVIAYDTYIWTYLRFAILSWHLGTWAMMDNTCVNVLKLSLRFSEPIKTAVN